MSGEATRLVMATGLGKFFERRTGWARARTERLVAVRDVDLSVDRGETVGLVGESGAGKSTLWRLLVRLLEPDSGTLHFDGVDLLRIGRPELRRMRRHFQIVFQDPYGSLNPRMRIGNAIGEPLTVHKLVRSRAERDERVAALLEQVGLDPSSASKFPHEFSGGQRQRVGIARAIACSPRFVVADEPVSALDPPVQAQIVNLLLDLQERLGLAYLFIGHDLRLVEQICDRVAVMYLGRIVEEAPTAELYREPLHPYTQALLASTPSLTPGAPTPPALDGEPGSPGESGAGCPFQPRCAVSEPECSTVEPELLAIGTARKVACHLVFRGKGETLRGSGA